MAQSFCSRLYQRLQPIAPEQIHPEKGKSQDRCASSTQTCLRVSIIGLAAEMAMLEGYLTPAGIVYSLY